MSDVCTCFWSFSAPATREPDQPGECFKKSISTTKISQQNNWFSQIEVFRRRRKLFLVFEYVDRTVLEELEDSPKGLVRKRTAVAKWRRITLAFPGPRGGARARTAGPQGDRVLPPEQREFGWDRYLSILHNCFEFLLKSRNCSDRHFRL